MQNPPSNTTILQDQAQEEVLSSNIALTQPLCFLVSQTEHTPRPLCKSIHSSHKILLSINPTKIYLNNGCCQPLRDTCTIFIPA
jgi:hypothetical protein